MRGRGVAAAIVAAALVFPTAAAAQQVTGLTAEQEYGFTTLKWDAVPGATEYEIERTPIDADDQPTGEATIVGRWRPDRTITPESPAFAESGYRLGDRYQWRVRVGTDDTTWSDPVRGTTMDHWGTGPGASLRTPYEENTAGPYTTSHEEAEYTSALDVASDRMRVVELARTIEDRPVNLLIFGYPKPPDTAQEISDRPTYAINCNVHGNEASGREACFTMARQLAFSEDPEIVDMLSRMVVLLVPSINADGRAHNTRGNTTGQDLNRDHALIEQNETKGYAIMLRDYTPDVAVDSHEGDSEDLPILAARHLNVEQGLFEEGRYMVNEWMYGAASQSGWWMGVYSNGGDSHEGILRNTQSLKNTVSMLGEARASAGSTRPGEGSRNGESNRLRKVYAHLWEDWEGMRYFASRMGEIRATVAQAVAFQTRNETGTTVLRGAYPWPLVPHVADDPDEQPNVDAPLAERILTPAPCGYFISEAEYTMPRMSSSREPVEAGSVAQRLAIHGIEVEPAPGGVFVPLRQPYRGLIAPILDQNAVLPMIDTAERRYCFREEGEVSGTVPATLSLTLGAPASFGAFVPGVDDDYAATTTATVTSSAGDATLSASDPGHLANGSFTLADPLEVALSKSSWDGPVSNDAVTITFGQHIGADESLRTGTYSKTLTFTLSTTNP